MDKRTVVKGLLFTFAAGFVAVVMASPAFACVPFKGQMTVEGQRR